MMESSHGMEKMTPSDLFFEHACYRQHFKYEENYDKEIYTDNAGY